MKRFKEEYQYAVVTINSPALGRFQINTETADPNEWANVKEFEHLTEDVPTEIPQPKVQKEIIADSWEDFTLNELRERFPDIKATSKKAFIDQIGG